MYFFFMYICKKKMNKTILTAIANDPFIRKAQDEVKKILESSEITYTLFNNKTLTHSYSPDIDIRLKELQSFIENRMKQIEKHIKNNLKGN